MRNGVLMKPSVVIVNLKKPLYVIPNQCHKQHMMVEASQKNPAC